MTNGSPKIRCPYLPDGYRLDKTSNPDDFGLRREDGSRVELVGWNTTHTINASERAAATSDIVRGKQ